MEVWRTYPALTRGGEAEGEREEEDGRPGRGRGAREAATAVGGG